MHLPPENHSLWETTDEAPRRYLCLEGDLHTDVVIVGAGITGLTAAFLLKRAGRHVTVLEGRTVGSGVTGRTTAHLTEILDSSFDTLKSDFGTADARLAVEANREAIRQIEALVAELQIDCQFERVPGYRYVEREEDVAELEKELSAARELGVEAQLTRDVPVPRAVSALYVPNQAQFHPLRYIHALAEAVVGDGSHIFEGTRVHHIRGGELTELETEHGTVFAKEVIIATHNPVGMHFVQTEVAPYRSYVVGLKVPKGQGPRALLWDTADPYHYIRSHAEGDHDVVIVGGADHKTGQEPDTMAKYEELARYALERFPQGELAFRWSSEVFEPADGLPYIGRPLSHSHYFVSTGYAGNGITFGTAAGMLLRDLVIGRDNPWAKVFSPKRVKPFAAAAEFIKENSNVGKRFVVDRIRPADVKHVRDIPPDEGRLVQLGARKVAVYRDPGGELHAMSPVCTHMGCIVQWNTAEKTWDCPCHGGMFSATGEVLSGPPPRRLARVDLDERITDDAPRTVHVHGDLAE